MSLLRRLSGDAERRVFTGPWGEYNDGRIPSPGSEAVSSAGQVVNSRTALSLIDFLACVSLVCDDIGMLPVDALRKSGDERVPVTPEPQVVRQPDPEMERGEFWSGMTMSLMLRGNGYALVAARDSNAWPTALKLLNPDAVRPQRHRDTNVVYYQLASGRRVEKWDMVHIPWVRQPGELEGLSPVECARRGLGLGIATEEYGAKWFRDGAIPSSLFETDGTPTDVEVKKTMARWVASHGGRRRPAFVSGGLKWRQISVAPNESQFLETANLNTERTARLCRVPPHMIGHLAKTTSWGTGIEEQAIGYVVHTLGPYITRYEAALTRILPRPQYAKWNVRALLRGNTRDRFLSYAIARQWGWLCVNDIRALEDLGPIEGGDVYLQPLNMVDATEALRLLMKNSGVQGGGE